MNKPFKSALSVNEGIDQPSQINTAAVSKLKSNKHKPLTANDYFRGIREGNRTILSKAITLVESSLPKHQELAEEIIGLCLKESAVTSHQSPVTGPQSAVGSHQYASIIRIGITGVPGVGKSTFIEVLGKELTAAGHKLAVLAIDPSSARSKGSILGDKTRMEELSVDPAAFIRPSPSAGSLGGVARKTRETIMLCEAAGFDVIFVETVGVGQSETAVHSMVDFFLLLMLAGAGDELQGIKRGILEMADTVIINKADGDNISRAKTAKAQCSEALHLYPPSESGWKPAVDICSCKTKEGIRSVWDIITNYQSFTKQSGYFYKKRMEQNRQVMFETIEEALKANFYSRKDIHHLIKKMESDIVSQKINPYLAANQLIRKYFRKSK
jgi:LAO/AO transport system kinase